MIGGLFLCLWVTRLVLRELAKGWAIDDKRRGSHWRRPDESFSSGGDANDTNRH